MKQTRIRLFSSVLLIIIIPMALYLLGIWKNSDSHLTTQVLTSGIAVLVVVGFSMALWIYSGIIRPLEKLHEAMNEIKEGNLDKVLDAEDVGGEIRQLMEDFEEMRIRLKENQEEKLQYDRDNKELISNITHDLKTPITSIKGYVEGILDGVARSPEQMNRYIRTIYNKANDMDRLIDELTFYTKIDANRIPYHFEKVRVTEFFRDCADEVGTEMEAGGMLFSYISNGADEASHQQYHWKLREVQRQRNRRDRSPAGGRRRLYPGGDRGPREGDHAGRPAEHFQPLLPRGHFPEQLQRRQRHRPFDRKKDH